MIELEEDLVIKNKDKNVILEKGDKIQLINESLEEVFLFTKAKEGGRVTITIEDYHNGLSYTHAFSKALFSDASLGTLTVVDYEDDSNLFIKLSKISKIEGSERRLSLRLADGTDIFMR